MKQLSDEIVGQIRTLYKTNKISQVQLAKKFNIRPSQVSQIIWNHSHRDASYTPPIRRKEIDIKLCKALRESGMTYTKIAEAERISSGRSCPYSWEHIRKICLGLRGCSNRARTKE